MKHTKSSLEISKQRETIAERDQRLLQRQARVISALTGNAARSTNSQARIAEANAQRVVVEKKLSKARVQEIAKSVGIWTESGKLTPSYKK